MFLPDSASLDRNDLSADILGLVKRTEANYEILDSNIDDSESHEGIWFRLRWDGLPYDRDFTWALDADIYDDFPEMTMKFPKKTRTTRLASKAATQPVISL